MNNFYVKYKSPVAVILVIILLGGFMLSQIFNPDYSLILLFPKIKIIADNGEQPVDKMTGKCNCSA